MFKPEEYTSVKYGDFKFTVSTTPSEYSTEWDYMGEYTDRPSDSDAIDRKYRGDMDRHSYRYFEPMNSLESHRKDFTERGYSKHQAYEEAKALTLRDYRYAEKMNNGDISLVDVSVKVSYKGHKLGQIATSTDSDNVDEILLDLYLEVMGEAVSTLEDLDSKPKTLAKARDILMILKAQSRAAYETNRRECFLNRITRWRDMSFIFQDNRTVTRHMWKHIQTKKIAYYRVR